MARSDSQHPQLAAVEIDGGAMHPGRARRDQEGHEIGHVLDLAVAPKSHAADEALAHLVLGLAGRGDLGANALPLPLGLDQARMHAVDLHAVLLADVGEAFGEGRHRGIHRAADGELGLRLAAAGAADADERAAACLEQRPGLACEPHVAEEFQRVAVLPIGIGQLEEAAAPGGPGVVDQDVEVPELAAHRFDQRLLAALAPQVERGGRGLAAPARIAAAVCSSAAASRPVTTRSQPSAAKDSAIACPIPRLAPVTSATLPPSPKSMFRPSRRLAPGSLPIDPSGQARFRRFGNGLGRGASGHINRFDETISD